MWKPAVAVSVPAMIVAVAIPSQSGAAQSPQAPNSEPVKCEYVVSADPGAKPTQMCLTKSEWAAKKKVDASDPNRIVCHYEEEPGTRFASRKICMSAAQWDDRKLQDRQDVERIQLQSAGRGP